MRPAGTTTTSSLSGSTGTTWTPVTPPVLDKVPTEEAGVGNNEARIATAPDGASGVVTWAETVAMPARRPRCMPAGSPARRPAPSARAPTSPRRFPAPIRTVRCFSRVADQPDVDIDAGGTAWVVFRQNITYGGAAKHRAFSRPFVGDAFGGAQLIDAMPEVPTEGRDLTRIDVNGAGQGLSRITAT